MVVTLTVFLPDLPKEVQVDVRGNLSKVCSLLNCIPVKGKIVGSKLKGALCTVKEPGDKWELVRINS